MLYEVSGLEKEKFFNFNEFELEMKPVRLLKASSLKKKRK